MALNGDLLTDRVKERIKKMVNNHHYIKELKNKAEALEVENNELKELKQSRVDFMNIDITSYRRNTGNQFRNKFIRR